MTIEANLIQEGDTIDWTPTAAVSAGEVLHLPDGRVGFSAVGIAAGEKRALQVGGIVELAKTASMVMLAGSRIFWDSSASKAHLLQATDTVDFFVGTCVEDAASAATTVKVAINREPQYTISLAQGFVAAPIPAITANPQGMMFAHGNGVNMVFDTAAEAEKFDALSLLGIKTATPGVLNALICVNTNGDDAAFDLNVGLADGTHATTADSIAESLFCHIDGNSTNILAESDDDDAIEVAATDTTVDFVAGTPFLFQADLTDWSDIQLYINGVNVLAGSTFSLSGVTGPMKLLAHMEKTANNSPGNVSVMDLGFIATDV